MEDVNQSVDTCVEKKERKKKFLRYCPHCVYSPAERYKQ